MSEPAGPFFARLLVAGPVLEFLQSVDDAVYAQFLEARDYAESVLAERLDGLMSPENCLVLYGDLLLVIRFSPKRERFYIAAVAFDDHEPPTPGAPAALRPPLVEQMLAALGLPVEAPQPAHAPPPTDGGVTSGVIARCGAPLWSTPLFGSIRSHGETMLGEFESLARTCRDAASSSAAALDWKRDPDFHVVQAPLSLSAASWRALGEAIASFRYQRVMYRFLSKIGYVAFVTLACPHPEPSP